MFSFIHHNMHIASRPTSVRRQWTTYKPCGPLSLCHVLPPAPLTHPEICAGTSSSG